MKSNHKQGPIRKKLVIIGDGNCGKTSLLYAFAKNEFINEHQPTIVDTLVTIIQIDGKQIELVIYDTAGQEEYDKLRPIFYKDSNVIILCYSIDLPNSLLNITDRWLPEIRFFCPQLPIILVGIKKDLRNDPITSRRLKLTQQRAVRYEEGQQIGKRIRAAFFFECSCKTFENINEIFQTAAKISCSNFAINSNASSQSSSVKIKTKRSMRKKRIKNCSIL